MLWCNFADLFEMHAVDIYLKFHMGVYTSNNALHEKVVWQAKSRRLSAENFYGEMLMN